MPAWSALRYRAWRLLLETRLGQTNRKIEFLKLDLGDVASLFMCITQRFQVLKNIHTAQTTFVTFSHLQFVVTAITFASQGFGIFLNPQWSGLCLLFPRTDLEPCWCSVIAFDGSARKGRSPWVHTTLLHCAPLALRGFAVTEDLHLSQVMSPCTRTHSMNREDSLTRSGQATPIPQGGNVSRRTTSNSLPAPPSVPSDHIYDHESDHCASGSASRSNPHAEDALYGPGGYEKTLP